MFNRGSAIRFASRALACAAATFAVVAATTVPSAAQPRLYASYARTYNATPVQVPSLGMDNFLFWPQVPRFKIFDTPSIESAARDVAYGPDKNLWITSDCDGTIVRLTPTGGQKAFVYKPGSGCFSSTSITPGTDNSMWFADQYGNFVGRIDESGSTKLYPLPVDTCNYPTNPLSITLGPDNAMWFTVIQGGSPNCPGGSIAPAIVRLTASGNMTFYYTGPRGFSGQPIPLRFVTGSKGSLTFTAALPQNGLNLALGHVTTGGGYSYTPAFGVAHLYDNYVTMGADRRLWVTSYNDNAIFAVGSSGHATTYTVPTVHGESENPFGITLGLHERLYFTTLLDNQLGAVTPDGHFTFFAVPKLGQSNGSGGGIALGANGSIWFTLPHNVSMRDVVRATNLP